MDWLPILLALAAAGIGTAYWFGYLDVLLPSPATKNPSPAATAKQEEESAAANKETTTKAPPAKDVKKKSEKKRPPQRPSSSKSKHGKLPADPRFIRRFGGHSDIIVSMSISPNGEWMATSGVDGQVRVAEVTKGSNRYLHTTVGNSDGGVSVYQDHISALSWSGDGRTVVGAIGRSREIAFYRIRPKKDGTTTTGGGGGGTSFPYELHELVKRRFNTTSKVGSDNTIGTCLVDQAHSNSVLVITNTGGDGGQQRGNTVVWDGKTGDAVGVVTTVGDGVRLSPDGNFLCGCSMGGGAGGGGAAQVKLFEVQRKKVKGEVEPIFDQINPKGVMTLVPGKAKVVDVTFCNGNKCVVCCDDGNVQIWDLNVDYRNRQDPKLLCSTEVLKGKKIVSVAARFVGNTNRIAVATSDTALHLLTYSSATEEVSIGIDFTIEQTHAEGIADIQFCPATGNVLYSRGLHSKDVYAWDIK